MQDLISIKVMTQQELETFWNNKHPKNPVIYTGRAVPKKCPHCNSSTLAEQINIDVRTMLAPEDALCKQICAQNRLKGVSHDQTMQNIQTWVVKNVKYIGDDLNQATVEYWQFPFETITFKTGDCEDGALLIAALAINCGVPAFRVRVVAGMVQPAPTAPQGGHGYVSYLRESDNQWVALDWCYLEDSATWMLDKKVLSKNEFYKEMWFSFNHLHSWSNKQLEFSTF
jgi:predicted transglutaminase-like cysteine proteinase